MKKILLLVTLLTVLSWSFLAAQSREFPDGFAIRFLAPNYQWPLESVSTLNVADFTGGFGVEYYRFLSNNLDLSFPLSLTVADLPLNDQGATRRGYNAGLNALLNLNIYKGKFFRPHLFAGAGGLLVQMKTLTLDVPVGLGLNFLLGKSTFLSATAGYHFNGTDLRDHLQAGLGLRMIIEEDAPKKPTVADRDGDGIPDGQDLCPDQAGTAALNGCPDRDRDGVADGSDECPDTAGMLALAGCPDTDADGIADKNDGCPNQAGPASNNGCPDRDGDGLADDLDDCPNQPGTAANRGCPDTDGDGVVDRLDSCPNEAGPAINKGCPEIEDTDREVLIEAVKAIEFETASANIRASSLMILDKVADIMARYPGYKLRIGGHTDSIGSVEANQSLSEKRAKSCYDYLLSKGVAAARMSYTGYGESQPIADNMYAPGREKNRRVEFDVYIE
jgi:OmpA-OmpF porin, OOP family